MRANPPPPRSRLLAVAVVTAATLALSACGRAAPTDLVEDAGADPEIAGVSVTSPDAIVSTLETQPGDTTTTAAVVAPQQILHKVQPGDTLSGIASIYDTTVRELADYNGIADVHSLTPGQELAIPPPSTAADADNGGSTVGAAGTSDTTIDQ